MQGQSIDVDRGNAHAHESAGVMFLLERLQDDWGRAGHEWLKIGGHGHRMALRIVDCESGKMLAIGELLHGALQGCRVIPLQVAFHISAQALAQQFSPVLQIAAHSAGQNVRLVVRGTKRDQSHSDNEGDNQSSA